MKFIQTCSDIRPELLAYLQRLTGRLAIAEEVLQEALLRGHEHRAELPEPEGEVRAWLFAVATRLAIDAMRKHSNWRESALDDFRQACESDPEFVRLSLEMAGTPETENIAVEHLAACFTCVLRSFPEHKAAALLLREVYGFSMDEAASLLNASNAQVKNWLQETRRALNDRYERQCALINKNGVCHQCRELAGFFRQAAGDLEGSARDLDARIGALRSLRDKEFGRWHTMMFNRKPEAP